MKTFNLFVFFLSLFLFPRVYSDIKEAIAPLQINTKWLGHEVSKDFMNPGELRITAPINEPMDRNKFFTC